MRKCCHFIIKETQFNMDWKEEAEVWKERLRTSINNDDSAELTKIFEELSQPDKKNKPRFLNYIQKLTENPDFYLLTYAADKDKEDAFKIILDWDYNIGNEVRNSFVYLARTKNLKYLKLMLANRKFNVNERDKIGETALCVAAEDPACLKVLLAEKDIDLNQYGQNISDLPLFNAIESGSEECINLLINDDRLYEDKFGSEPTLLIAAEQLKTFFPLCFEVGMPNKDQWVYQQAINRLLYESKNTMAQLKLDYYDTFDGRSILNAACENGNLKLFKYFLYANGWGTKVHDESPGEIGLKEYFLSEKSDPNNADNWEKSNELFWNFFHMNDALRSSFVASDLLSQNSVAPNSKFPIIATNNIIMIINTIMQFYVRDTKQDFLKILDSPSIRRFINSTIDLNLIPPLKKQKFFMVKLLEKIRTYYGFPPKEKIRTNYGFPLLPI